MSALFAALVLALAPSFAFGRSGGNIRPLSAAISRTGSVVVDGTPTGTVGAARLAALARVARTQAFFSLPATVSCAGTLPDVAARYVRVSAGGRSWKVTVHGACNARFDRVYRALARAAGLPG